MSTLTVFSLPLWLMGCLAIGYVSQLFMNHIGMTA